MRKTNTPLSYSNWCELQHAKTAILEVALRTRKDMYVYIWTLRGPARRRYQFSTVDGVVVQEGERELGGKGRSLYSQLT